MAQGILIVWHNATNNNIQMYNFKLVMKAVSIIYSVLYMTKNIRCNNFFVVEFPNIYFKLDISNKIVSLLLLFVFKNIE